MSTTPTVYRENRLLATLPAHARNELLAQCERVDLACDDQLVDIGGRILHAYFPIHSRISLKITVNQHADFEVTQIGNEGMCGMPLALDIDISPVQASVQCGGAALRIPAVEFGYVLENEPALRQAIKRYIYVQMKQLAQLAACNRYHLVEERLARCLLMMVDRAGTDELHITHDALARILGVRRVGITNAAGSLQKRHLMCYSRGIITVSDRDGLEAASCACYRADKEIYDDIMSS